MNTKHIVSRKKNTLNAGFAETTGYRATVKVAAVDTRDHTVRINVDEQWFNATDLRETAKLFLKMADVLEAKAAT